MGSAASVRVLGVGLGVELDLLAFAQLIECGVVDGATVEEDILTTIRGLDEAEPSVSNEPGDFPVAMFVPPWSERGHRWAP